MDLNLPFLFLGGIFAVKKMKRKQNDLVIFPCPPLSLFKEAPKDQSESQLVDCPDCKKKMWLSEKKKGLLISCVVSNTDIVLKCYDCITEYAKEHPELFLDAELLGI